MSEQEDRLGLIARAGKRLRTSQNEAGIQSPVSSQTLAQAAGFAPQPIANPIPDVLAGTAQSGANIRLENAPALQPARLGFSSLRREGMLTPDNMRTNLGFEYNAIKRKLLGNLSAARQQGRLNNVVMITSPRPADGKTFTTVNLAISLASQREARILVVDADIVRRKLSAMFNSSDGVGLVDLVNGRCSDLGAAVRRCADLPSLDVLSAGSDDEHSAELLGSRRMSEVIEEISRRYADGIVLLDTPPVLASPESLTLAGFVHQIVMVVASGQTTRSQLQASLETVAICPNISLLLNKAPEWARIEGDTYYYYGYYDQARPDGDRRPDSALRQ